ncbi:tRNA (adenosine(37)-N6)-dimethylallyltransferase MiaA [Hyphococcus sp.]|uniref:tRNA (adenosine(37)-N6)-dimethylallyltransferase MiaA n=1 Tax=Hyphococcus sp. TaxID=2038636 RepID=UPI003D0D7E5E
MKKPGLIFIAGPTASGKSAAALALARTLGGEVINADAMQVYGDLNVITARPTADDEVKAPHRLYGVLQGVERCSAGRWARLAKDVLYQCQQQGKVAVVCGGTGLYFRALEEGLSPIPETPGATRAEAEARRRELGPEAFREEVVAHDPDMARLPAGDSQRLIRAWEVFRATGKPLSWHQAQQREPLIDKVDARIVIEPPRDVLYARCDARAVEMMRQGGVEEVRALLERNLDPALPVMKALGVPEIAAMLRGDMDETEALQMLQQNTRRFAKRQLTWFRNQAADWPRAATAEDAEACILEQLGSL